VELCQKKTELWSLQKLYLLPPVSIEATWVCIPIGNSEVLLAAIYKSPRNTWNGTVITEFFSRGHKSILEGDLNDKYLFWNGVVSNTSGSKLLNLLHINEFEISAPHYPTHYSPTGNGGVLEIVVHKNVRLSEIVVSDIQESDHLPIIFHLLDHIRTRNLSNPVEKFTDWKRFQRLASEINSPRIRINSEEDANKGARDFTASIA
jgi:hypothetical protein